MPDGVDNLVKLVYRRLYGDHRSEEDYVALVKPELPALSRDVAELSRLYTRERGGVNEALLGNPRLRRAYLSYFLPSNFRKIQAILQELWLHPESAEFIPRNLRVLDLGCGPGTNLLGFLGFLSMQKSPCEWVACTAVDSVDANLQDLRYLFDHWVRGWARAADDDQASPPANRLRAFLHTHRANIAATLRLQEGHSFDFIVLGNVLNELFPDAPRRIAKRGQLLTRVIESWLAPKGFVILLEPALKKTSRDLLLLRDRLIDGLGLNVYSPCVHSCHCPAVAPGQPSDWCHESLNWQAPWLIREIDRRIGNRKTALKYSYVVLSRTKHSVRDAAQLCLPTSLKPDGQQTWRVVSEVMEERGKASVFLCGPRGRVKVAHLQKHVSETNEEFLYLNRGQVVMAGPLEIRSASDWRVKPASAVRILMGRRQ